MLDGLVVTGGAFDVDPSLYGAADRHDSVVTKDRRTAFELSILKGFPRGGSPGAGHLRRPAVVERGAGGHADPAYSRTASRIALPHEQPNPRTEPGHEVEVKAKTRCSPDLANGTATLAVNSAHHQAVAEVGAGVVISGLAPDGVIEAIEVPEKRFCLGVQWHPEYSISAADDTIFQALIMASESSH